MRISTVTSLLALSLFVASPPLLAQPTGPTAGGETADDAGSDESPTGDEAGEETGDDPDDADADDAEADDADDDAAEGDPAPEAAAKPARSLAAEGDDAEDEGDESPAEADDAEETESAGDAGDDTVVAEKPYAPASSRSPDSTVDSAWNHELDEFSQRYKWRLLVGGYIRSQYTAIQNDPGNGLIGQNDGFILGNARLTLQGTMRETLGFRFQFDGAVTNNDSANSPDGEVVTRLKDAYIFWRPTDFAGIKFGQFKPPFDVEEIFSTSEILFVDRSVGSRGVDGVEGFNQPGLSIQREVGLELGTDGYFPMASGDEPEGVGVSYGLAMTNGSDSTRSLNDNDQLAYYGRLGLHWGELVRIGGAYFTNDTLAGEQPDVIEESLSGYTADLTFTGWGVTAVASLIRTQFETPDVDINPTENASAMQVQLAYKEPYFGFQPAIRYAQYDPSDALDDDALTHITVGLNYLPPYPVRLTVNYTITQEEEGRELENNRFDTMLQVQW